MMMQQELLEITSRAFPAESEIEKCFVVCNRYLSDLGSASFEGEEKIEFNRDIRPLFIAEAEYYSFLSYARLFRPVDSVEGQRLFWMREKARFKKFCDDHKELLEYYNNGHINMDKEYFTEASSHYVTIISGFLALKKYDKYVRDELEVLAGFLK